MDNNRINFREKPFDFSIENPDHTTAISLIGRALSSPVRIEIIRALNKKPMLLSEVADAFDLQLSSTAFHLRVLEDANLIGCDYSTKRKGTLKWYSYAINKEVNISLREDKSGEKKPPLYTHQIAIGSYIDAYLPSSCGIATDKDQIMENSPKSAFINERYNAQLIWLKPHGHLTYAIPNGYADIGDISEINFSVELCAEARGFNNDYPSDITFWINGKELCTYTVTGDFGDRYGKFTPHWWFAESTKYGLLTNVTVKRNGVYLNEKLVNKKICLADLQLSEGNKTTLTIGVKKDALHLGGLNIFGEKFGDFNQAIIFNVRYV